MLIPTDAGVKIISYFPYESSSPVVIVDEYVDDGLNSSINLFGDKLPKTWANTTVRTIAFTYPPYVFNHLEFTYGMEIEILNLVQSVEKFNIVYVKKQYVNWGRKLKNGSYEGAYKDFRNYQIDLGIGMFFANSNDNWDFDETYPYMEDNAKWTVPMAKLQERWQRVLGIFTIEIWLLIFAFFVWISGLSLLMGVTVNERRYRRFWDCATRCYRCFLGQSVNLPEAGILRLALGFWVFFALLMTATFQGRLISVLNTNIREPQITNIEELIASKIKFGFYPDAAYLFLRPDNKIEWYIYNNYEECSVDSHCLNRVAFGGDFATFKTKKFIEYKISTSYLDEYGNSLIYVLDSTVFDVLVTMLFARGFPMYERVNLLLMRLKSAGFVEHTYKKAAFYAEKAMQSAKKTALVFQVLTMDEVFWLFWVLLIGLSFSVVVFVGEVCVEKWNYRVRTRGWVP
ncbi:hypothetical protein FQR65_LT01398 [Abscondita terminalis]|nr:hypothetical protein FQR65_LT01398 [Abscondita terminalis]